MSRINLLIITIFMLFGLNPPESLGASGASKNTAKKVLIVVSSHSQLGTTKTKTGFWLGELTHPFFVLKNKGFQVDIASIAGGKAPIDPKSLDPKDKDNLNFLKTYRNLIDNSLKLSEVSSGDYSAVLFAGGHGTMWDFPDSKAVSDISARVYEGGGVIAAVCHGPAALLNIKLSNGEYLVAGKSVTGFTNEEEDVVGLTKVVPFSLEDSLKKRSAKFVGAPAWEDHVVVDRRVVTGQNPGSAKSVGKTIAIILEK